MAWTRAVECAVVVVWAAAVGIKLVSQRRRGLPSIAFLRAATPGRRILEASMVGALLSWLLLVGLHGVGAVPALFEPRLFDSQALAVAGAVLGIGGLVLGTWSLMAMGRSWRIGIDLSGDEELVTHGPFAWSRNPIFLSMDLLAVGVFLMSGAVLFLVAAVLVPAGIHLQVLREEAFLAERHGERFMRYRQQVGRYLGRRPGA